MKIYLIRHAETVHNVGQAWYCLTALTSPADTVDSLTI